MSGDRRPDPVHDHTDSCQKPKRSDRTVIGIHTVCVSVSVCVSVCVNEKLLEVVALLGSSCLSRDQVGPVERHEKRSPEDRRRSALLGSVRLLSSPEDALLRPHLVLQTDIE